LETSSLKVKLSAFWHIRIVQEVVVMGVRAWVILGCALSLAGTAPAGQLQIIGGMDGGDSLAFAVPEDNYQPTSVSRATRVVPFTRNLAPGSILVKTAERKLYFVLPDGKAMQYPVGVGREGFTWSGRNTVSRKATWPDWRPPPVMIEREAKKGRFLPAMMKGGPKNPLGARALYIGATEFRIHGTTQPWSIGRAVSSGCIRMLNAHVIDLFDRVRVGATVVVEH
jgi:lipoprotein-anchoring transpeptidase ErfK/SrfK